MGILRPEPPVVQAAPDGTRVLVPVLAHRRVTGHPRPDAARVEVVPLEDALTRAWPTDAHFAAYRVLVQLPHRLTRESVAEHGVRVEMLLAIHDVDAHGASDVEAWWATERARVARPLDATGGYAYRTRGGYRLVHVLETAYAIASAADGEAWRACYLAGLARLAAMSGILADPACADWPHLYRLPHATREPDGQPEDRETLGDASRIGTWPALTAEELAAGAGLLATRGGRRAAALADLGAGRLTLAELALRVRRERARSARGPGRERERHQAEPVAEAGRAELTPERAMAYGRAALAGLVDELETTPEGERAMAAYRLAARAGNLEAAGVLDGAAAEAALMAAAVAAGLDEAEAQGHIRNGLRAGLQSPATIADRPPERGWSLVQDGRNARTRTRESSREALDRRTEHYRQALSERGLRTSCHERGAGSVVGRSERVVWAQAMLCRRLAGCSHCAGWRRALEEQALLETLGEAGGWIVRGAEDSGRRTRYRLRRALGAAGGGGWWARTSEGLAVLADVDVGTLPALAGSEVAALRLEPGEVAAAVEEVLLALRQPRKGEVLIRRLGAWRARPWSWPPSERERGPDAVRLGFGGAPRRIAERLGDLHGVEVVQADELRARARLRNGTTDEEIQAHLGLAPRPVRLATRAPRRSEDDERDTQPHGRQAR